MWLSHGSWDVEVILDYSGGPNVITRVLVKRRQEGQSQRETDWKMLFLALKVEEGAMSQGMRVTSKCWKRPGNRFSPRAFRRNAALLTP